MQPTERQDLSETLTEARRNLARRLRYIRQHHPEGPFTLEALSEMVGVSKRNLAQAESFTGANLRIETLIRIAHNLGIDRWAYFLDEEVFNQVNVELSVVKELAAKRVETVALRSTHVQNIPGETLAQLSELIAGITSLGQSANEILQEMPQPENSTEQDRRQR
ncbi:helix-turn-helix domain-containing protein [Streptomyces lavendofoliae]|uniref:helix-turn-helix domain-containing protein n=1 Tax=Streptomyces lavendofoliae TaxID=67314 RepID=UPI003D94A7A5